MCVCFYFRSTNTHGAETRLFMNVARVLRDTTTWTLSVHFPFCFRATEPKQEEKKEGKERKKKRDQALAADRHI